MKIQFYLVKKESDEVNVAKQAHATLQKEIDLVRGNLKTLGYDSETVSEVYSILTRKYGHPVFHDNSILTERELIAHIIRDWKPMFQNSYDYKDLPSMKDFIERQTDKEIIRVESGKERTIFFDEFVHEMQTHPWTRFGMPSRYNQEEDTIWAKIR